MWSYQLRSTILLEFYNFWPIACRYLFVDPHLLEAVEIMAYCLYDGKVDQESEFETKMYKSLIEQLTSMQDSFARSLIHAHEAGLTY